MEYLVASLCMIALVNCQFASSVSHKFDKANIQFSQEWHLWKGQHRKSYENVREELGKHLIWLSNQEYISQHNKYSDIFGYTLKMNQFGDLVSDQ